jgi:hypothetical protein
VRRASAEYDVDVCAFDVLTRDFALVCSVRHMCRKRRWCRIGDLTGTHESDGSSGVSGELENGRLLLPIEID